MRNFLIISLSFYVFFVGVCLGGWESGGVGRGRLLVISFKFIKKPLKVHQIQKYHKLCIKKQFLSLFHYMTKIAKLW